jgi:hypothetical protein
MKLCIRLASSLLAFFFLLANALAADVLTNRNDNARSGLVSNETILTPASVQAGLKLLFQSPVDGAVSAEPLCVSNQLIYSGGVSQGNHDLVTAATEKWLGVCIRRDHWHKLLENFSSLRRAHGRHLVRSECPV